MLLFSLLACSDYNFTEEKPTPDVQDSEPPDLFPDITVTPEQVDLGIVCGASPTEVTLGNSGPGVLTISALSATGGWTVGEVSLPVELPPDATLVVPISGGPGEGSLEISSDDPDEPALSVPLTAAANSPPEVTVLSPINGEVLSPSITTDFFATVSDDIDAPETLSLSWASDIDGPLSSAPAAADGTATLSWDANAHTSGTHNITLTATDSCGASTSFPLAICQDEGYVADSLDLSTWNFEGSATYNSTGGWVVLTEPLTNQSGTAFQTSTTVSADNVVIEFSFFVSGGSGADGISLTALDTTRMTGFVGTTGGGIGYGGLPGWSLEVDTWYNAENSDPTPEDHVSLHIDGDVAHPLVWAALPEMEDSNWHTMSVSVTGIHIIVAVDGVTVIDDNVSALSSFPAYVGFTAGTGAATNYHLIDALEVTRYVCEAG